MWLDFQNPVRVLIANHAAQVIPLLEEAAAHCAAGGYAAGYVSFDAAAGLDPAFPVRESVDFPLLVFGLFDEPARKANVDFADQPLRRDDWQPSEDFIRYQKKIERIRAEIGQGNVYQVNYTIRLESENVDPLGFFQAAAVTAPYGAYLDFEQFTFVSASPELLFRLDGNSIMSSPMKGTAARGLTNADDQQQKFWLAESTKNQAENLMITDMVRNDLGRIAETGSVSAERIFEIHKLPTVWQLTSTVRATTHSPLAEIFRGLFPAASITGAPKIASARLIHDLETTARGVYTGAIGYMGPQSNGRQAQFSVAIRTAVVDKRSGRGSYGVGGGIVWDSIPEEEYAEAGIKARVLALHENDTPFQLLETLRWTAGEGFFLLERHLERLRQSADYFSVPFDLSRIERALSEAVEDNSIDVENQLVPRSASTRCRRIRLLLDFRGDPTVNSLPFELVPDAMQRVMPAAMPVNTADSFLYHKTTRREVYNAATRSVPDGVEPLLWNAEGFFTESSIANLVYQRDGRSYTPPVSDGLLGGTLRQALLDEGRIEERTLPVGELAEVEALYLINALRGWRRAELLPRLES